MFYFNARTTAQAAVLCAALLTAQTSSQAQEPPASASAQPVAIGPLSADQPALVSYRFRQPNGKLTTVKLRRLPASCVVREGTASVSRPLAAHSRAPFRAFAAPFNTPPSPKVVTDPQIYNTELDYSHDNTPDTGWIFPTRGYDLRNMPKFFRLSLNSLIYPTDAPYTGMDGKTYSYDNFGAPIELIQLGRSAQISTMRVSMGMARETQGAAAPTLNLSPAGGTAVIMFWDGVYNNATDGSPRDGQGAYKLATDSTGASGVLVQMGQGFGEYIINFDKDATGTLGRFNITDAKGRIGLTIAAVYDPNAGTANGEPLSTREDGVYLRPGASVGQNKYFFIKHGALDVGTPSYNSDGVASTTNTLYFDPNDSSGDIFGSSTTSNVDGSVAYQIAPADLRFNPGEGIVSSQTMQVVPAYAPLNTSLVLYGTELNGNHASRGELRGRIRLQGVDPDTAANLTKVVSPYDPTPATPSLPKVPGESKMNRFRFTFISPPVSADFNWHILWNPETQLRPPYKFFQQETYSLPSYGDNSDYAPGTTQHGTTLRYNYRLRGIPTGTYSLLVQAIPIVDIAPGQGGSPIITTDMSTPYNFYPGSDYAVYFNPSIIIGESLFTPPNGTLSSVNYDYYTSTVVQDIKLHLPTDVAGGAGGLPDGMVDATDFGILVGEYDDGPFLPGSEAYDITGGVNGVPDGFVNATDFALLVESYNTGIVESAGY